MQLGGFLLQRTAQVVQWSVSLGRRSTSRQSCLEDITGWLNSLSVGKQTGKLRGALMAAVAPHREQGGSAELCSV